MAKKRNSSEMIPPTSPIARQQATQLSDDLAQFCREAAITLPCDDFVSAVNDEASIEYRIVKMYSFLWWSNKPALESAISDFFRSLSSTQNSTSQQVKLGLILDKLEGPAKATKIQCITPKTARIIEDMSVLEPTQSDDSPSPSPAPTKARSNLKNIKDHFNTTKSRIKPLRGDDTATHRSVKTSMAPPAPNTSFTTTATKSFDRSLQSSFDAVTQDTAATSFTGEISPTRRDSDYLPSLTTTECGELMNKLKEVETSQKTARSKLPPFAPSTQSQSLRDTDTTFGSSVDTSVFDMGQEDVDQFIASGYHWQKRDSALVSQDEQVTADGLLESPKRQRLATPEPQTNARFEPSHNFAQFQNPSDFSTLPFHVQWEAQRLLQGGHVTPQSLQEHWRSQSLRELYEIAQQQEKLFHKSFESESPDLQDLTFTGQLRFATSRNGVLFDMVLDAPIKGRSTDLQRRFGCDRTISVTMPDLHKPPAYLKGRNLIDKFKTMAKTPQTFLGRRWVHLLVKPHKGKKKVSSRTAKPEAFRLLFVAVDDAISLSDVIDYMIPFHDNASQKARKLYSRLELFTSASKAAITFEPAQISFGVQDQYATSDPSDTTFLDPALRKDFKEPKDSAKEMNDGCQEISYFAMCKVAEALKLPDLPSSVQGRIAGSKGIWFRSRDTNLLEPHIKISKTQNKVKRTTLSGCNAGTLTLNVKKVNSSARNSSTHMAFLSILKDRGVPTETIFDVARSNVQTHIAELESALKSSSPMPMRRWIHQRHELREQRNRTSGIQNVGGFPKSREEGVIQLLEAGVLPNQDAFLAAEIKGMVKDMFNIERKKFKIPLAASTTLTGMADPFGSLQPGEIHVHFSPCFKDTITGESLIVPSAKEALIARNPAMAPWDMQKVRIVFCQDLFHLPNMVILSAKGKRPLAELLQGGDYDGDTFWITWDQRLVSQFKNAPAPWNPPSVRTFGIKEDPQTLRDFVTDPHSEVQWCNFLGEMATSRLRPDQLGTVTLLHERVTYSQGRIDSKQALSLVHLHDYLVDADKQGYDFTSTDLEHFKQKIGLPKALPTPRHWKYTKIYEEHDDMNNVAATTITGNIIDDLFSVVVQPMVDLTIRRANEALSCATEPDPHFFKFFDDTWGSVGKDSVIRHELTALEKELRLIRDKWTIYWNAHQPKLSFDDLVTRLRAQYDQIMPDNVSDPKIEEWLRRQGHELTIWDRLKASALAKWHYRGMSPGKFVFCLAGRELCKLKANYVCSAHSITEEMWCCMKPNKQPKQFDIDPGDDDGGDDEEDPGVLEIINEQQALPTGETGYC